MLICHRRSCYNHSAQSKLGDVIGELQSIWSWVLHWAIYLGAELVGQWHHMKARPVLASNIDFYFPSCCLDWFGHIPGGSNRHGFALFHWVRRNVHSCKLKWIQSAFIANSEVNGFCMQIGRASK